MSVRKRSWKTSTGQSREAFVVAYADKAGRHIKTFERRGDAVEFHDKLRALIRSGKHVPLGRKVTVADVCDQWIKRVEADGRERTTVRQYREHVRIHIAPRIGHVKVRDLTTGHLEKFRDDLLDSVSRPMARKVLTSLRSALKSARRAHLMEAVSIKRDKRSEGKLEDGRDYPTPSEVKRLIEAAPDIKRRALLLVLCLTGLRSSEVRGLRWRDIDLVAGVLSVRQRADRYNTIGSPKSTSSVRSVPLDRDTLIPALKAWKITCPVSEYVFPTSTGAIDHHSNILRALAPIMTAAGVVDRAGRPKYALHAFRHFFASWCLNPRSRGGRELPIKLVQNWLGHSSINLTMDTYAHLLPAGDDHAELADATRALFGLKAT